MATHNKIEYMGISAPGGICAGCDAPKDGSACATLCGADKMTGDQEHNMIWKKAGRYANVKSKSTYDKPAPAWEG